MKVLSAFQKILSIFCFCLNSLLSFFSMQSCHFINTMLSCHNGGQKWVLSFHCLSQIYLPCQSLTAGLFKLPLVQIQTGHVPVTGGHCCLIQSPIPKCSSSTRADNQDWAFKESGLAGGQQSFRLLSSRRQASPLQPLKSSSYYYTHSDPQTLYQKTTKTSGWLLSN